MCTRRLEKRTDALQLVPYLVHVPKMPRKTNDVLQLLPFTTAKPVTSDGRKLPLNRQKLNNFRRFRDQPSDVCSTGLNRQKFATSDVFTTKPSEVY
jgi:hypothetical protein